MQGLGAAAPSGAGESGWLGGRKPPLPSRGVVSLQKNYLTFGGEKRTIKKMRGAKIAHGFSSRRFYETAFTHQLYGGGY